MDKSNAESLAALLTYWCKGVYGYRWVVLENHPEHYVRRVAREISEALAPLVEHHSEYVNLSELELLHESFGDGDYPEDGWSLADVLALLRRLPDLAANEFRQSCSLALSDSSWYRVLVGFLNDVLPGDDGVWINIEGPLVRFMPALLRIEVEGFRQIKDLSDASATWIGKLAVLCHLSEQRGLSQDDMKALYSLVGQFNEESSQVNLLG